MITNSTSSNFYLIKELVSLISSIFKRIHTLIQKALAYLKELFSSKGQDLEIHSVTTHAIEQQTIYFPDVVTPSSKQPEAIFICGGFGAGKSTLGTKISQKKPTYTVLDADLARESMSEFQRQKAANPKIDIRDFHVRACQIRDGLCVELSKNKENFIYLGSGKDQSHYVTLFKSLKKIGYRVQLIFIEISKDEAYKRCTSRSQQQGSYVPSKQDVDTAIDIVQTNFEVFKMHVSSWQVYSNEKKFKFKEHHKKKVYHQREIV